MLHCTRTQTAPLAEESTIAKNRNTFAKRARESEKKRKADEKRATRRLRQSGQEKTPAEIPAEEQDQVESPKP